MKIRQNMKVGGVDSKRDCIARQTSNSTLSKYFINNSPNKTYSLTSETMDSPYKHSLTEIKRMSLADDGNDFQTPIAIKKVRNNFPPKKLKQTKLNRPKKNVKNSLVKCTKDNFENLDVHPEHLQMAIALSKSTLESENPELAKETREEDLPTVTSPVKFNMLERFGFKSTKTRLPSELDKIWLQEVSKKLKSSKFRFITPVLYIRNDEERECLITTKISSILNQPQTYMENHNVGNNFEITSRYLQDLQSNRINISNIHTYSHEELNNCKFLVQDLPISPSHKSSYGCLLRKWEEIPGRIKSPVKTVQKSDTNSSSLQVSLEKNDKLDDIFQKQRSCPSPDLFDSDVESCSPAKTNHTSNKTDNDYISSKNYLSNYGIEHFEFFEDLSKTEQVPKSSKCENSACSMSENESEMNTSTGTIIKQKNTENCSEVDESDLIMDLTQSSSSGHGECDDLKSSQKYTKSEFPNLEGHCYEDNKHNKSVLSIEEYQQNDLTISEDNKTLVQNVKERNEEYKDGLDSFKKQEEIICTDDTIPTEIDESLMDFTHSSSSEHSDKITSKDNNINTEVDPSDNVKTSYRSSLNSTEMLNVTDYLTSMLSKSNSWMEKQKDDDQKENDDIQLSQISSSQESIIISDEELNYSSLHSKRGTKDNDREKISDLQLNQISNSQENIVISDEELNYSSLLSKESKNRNFYSLAEFEEADTHDNGCSGHLENLADIHLGLRAKYSQEVPNVPESTSEKQPDLTVEKEKDEPITLNDSFNYLIEKESFSSHKQDNFTENSNKHGKLTSYKPKETSAKTKITSSKPKQIEAQDKIVSTPNKDLIIKTENVTPMLNYDGMNTPSIQSELEKFGVKPLKRRRGIQLLKHIYECTHPRVEQGKVNVSHDTGEEEENRVIKRRKKNSETGLDQLICEYNKTISNQCRIIGDVLLQNESLEDLIFERKYSKKILSCAVPLQIVWFNFVSTNPELHEHILCYEPLHLEVIHLMLKEQSSCKFHIQDLITFLDRKCITFRTSRVQKECLKI